MSVIMGRIIGLDVGINSVGFSFVDMDKNEILEMGSHLFEVAEQPKTGASLATPRREARGMRRRLSRKATKIARLRKELRRYDLPVPKIIQLNKEDKSPWQLRKEGLERLLSDEELGRVLIHFAKHPGFQTNRKSAPPNEETTFTKAGNDLYNTMLADGGKTIGAWLADQPKQRNDPGSYGRTVIRDHLREELKFLFTRQHQLGNPKATETLCEDVIQFAFFRRPLQSSEGMVGNCALYGESEKRAPKRAFHAELFTALSRLANLAIVSGKGERRLTMEEIALFEEKILKSPKITFAQARTILDLHEDEIFNLASYQQRKKRTSKEIKEEAEKNKSSESTNSRTVSQWKFLTPEQSREEAEEKPLVEMTGFHTLRRALEGISKMGWTALASQPDDLDHITYSLSFFEAEDDIRDNLKALSQPLSEEQIVALLKVTGFSQTLNISLKAAREIIPYLRQGITYREAVETICPDSHRRIGEHRLLPPLAEKTRNPIVDRALSKVRNVVNALISRHGMPDHFHVEMARDLGRSSRERKAMEAGNKERETFKTETRNHAIEIYGYEPGGDELARFRLWKEQGGFCAYSGEEIKPHHLQNGTDTQIDHILPYRRSYDDSWSNKVLCFARENQAKADLTAWEYMESNNMTSELEAFAKGQDFHRRKKLLTQNFDEEGWKSRHLNDTRYVARKLTEYLEENLQPNPGITKLVRTRKGTLTSKLRHLWGLPEKDRENDHRHHAVDALVIACATDSMVQRAAQWSRYQRRKKGDPGFFAEAPWENFRKDALAKRDTVFVTRQPARKTGGRLHKDTIMSLRFDEEGTWQAVKRMKVEDLKQSDLENLVDVEIVDGQPRGRNAALYKVLYDRLTAFDNKPDKAFAEPVFMPLKPGKIGPNGQPHGPQIRRVRVRDDTKAGFRFTDKITGKEKSIADNAEMAWTEVYEKNGKFYLLPVYTWQVATKQWPDRLITASKPEDEWDQLDSSYRFLFSLFKNDYVELENKKGETTEGYFKGTDRAGGTIKIEEHKGEFEDRLGVKTMKSFRKYHIDLFGQRSEVRERTPWRGEA